MKKWTILLLALLCSTAGAAAQDFSVVNPRCEYRDEPLGINTLTPRFSWQISARDRGFLQSAYELIVGDDRAAVAAGRGNLWRVKAKGAESLHIPYAGKALESGKEYYWSVRVWNAAGEVSPWMPVNRFSTGLMSPDAWSGARWIAMEVQPDSLRLVPGEEYNKLTIGDRITAPNRLPQFRREIDVRKPVKRAMAYVSGLGQFEFFINGDKVGDNFLDPAWSDYDKIVCYVPFDVTDRLQQGANVLGVMLGNGMYNVPRERYYKLLMTYGYPMMICKVDVEYADGTHDVIVSDGSWRTTTSPVTYSSIFGGEDYDATLERTGWMKPGYDDSSWQEVLFTSQRGELIAPKALPVKVMEEFPVFKIRKTKYGKWLYDMGQNFSGVACLTVKGKRGQAVRMNTCELFDPAVDSIQIHGGYRGETRYTYTLRGDAEPESWAPQFTYHGFRYVLIDGAVPAGEPRGAARNRGRARSAYPQFDARIGNVRLVERPAQQDAAAHRLGYQEQHGELSDRLPAPREVAVVGAAAPDVRFAAIYVRHVQPLREDARRHGHGAAAQWTGARHRPRIRALPRGVPRLARVGQRLRAGAALPL